MKLFARTCLVLVALLSISANISANVPDIKLVGTITDPLGAAIKGAKVELLQGKQQLKETTTNAEGRYSFSDLPSGRYQVRASAPSFATETSASFYVGGNSAAAVNLTLSIGPVAQQIVVSASGTELPDSQVGASVSVIPRSEFDHRLDVLDALRLVPGAQLLQQGQHGGVGSLFLRGGDSNANKILLDGVPVNEVGGRADFGNLTAEGVEQVEVLRAPNSVLYGSDALAGVVSLTTRRGTTRIPELAYSFDAGNFNTFHHEASLAGAFHQFDYLADFSRFDTGNSLPNNTYHNGTYTGNGGWAPNARTELRLTGHYNSSALGLPGPIAINGIPDDSFQRDQDTYISVTAQNQTTSRWHNLLRYGASRLREQFENPSPSGLPDAFGDFLGEPVTLRGANGFSTTGQAILDFGGTFPVNTRTVSARDFVYLQSDYSFGSRLLALFGFKFENERGFSFAGGTKTSTDRNNFSYTGELQGNLGRRLYATVGAGLEHNAIFGVAATPRVSLAYYLLQPRSQGPFNGTKLKFNYGQGIKEPSIFEETSSLFGLLSQLSNGPQLISQFRVTPIRPERSRSFDFGVEQLAANGKVKLGVTFFHNRFTNQVEFVDSTTLTQLGVPPAVAAQTAFGATVNSADTRALGAETELQLNLGHGFSARASYTYLDAVLQRSFSSDALCVTQSPPPCINPEIPGVLIGAFGPLVGNRPFRRAPHSGSFILRYAHPRYTLSLSGYLVGRRDDSTFAFDNFFGNAMLLPNRNLDEAYQKIDFDGSYRLNSHLSFFTGVENLANEHYSEAFGFPALPLTIRGGFRIRIGGE